MCKHNLCPYRACGLVLALPGTKSLLVEQELDRQKEKERAQGGRGGDIIPSCRRGAASNSSACSNALEGAAERKGSRDSHPGSAPGALSIPFLHPHTSGRLQLIYSSSEVTKLSPKPPLLPGQLQTSCFLELSSLDCLGEAPGV